MSRLKEKYDAEIKSAMVEKFGYKNVMQIPKLDKIVINMGVGEARENAKVLDAAIKDLETIHVYVTSEVSIQTDLMEEVTTHSVLRSSLSSLRLSTIR